jgi:hypothetical protein
VICPLEAIGSYGILKVESGMAEYSAIAREQAMKVQKVILRATAKEITWWQAAEIIGISDRSMWRWRQRYQEHGYDGLWDRRRGKPSPKRVPLKIAEELLQLYLTGTLAVKSHLHPLSRNPAQHLPLGGTARRNFGIGK